MGLICKKGLKGVPGNLSIQSATAVTKYTLNKNNTLIYGKKFPKINSQIFVKLPQQLIVNLFSKISNLLQLFKLYHRSEQTHNYK